MAYIYWDPSRELFHFNLPFLNRPILWYGFLFALGFFLAYWVLVYLLQRYLVCHSELYSGSSYSLREVNRFLVNHRSDSSVISLKKKTKEIADQLTLYVIIGTLIGARLGDFLFYQDWNDWAADPFSIFKIWNGGLASHGGAIGIFIALILFSRSIGRRYRYFSLAHILDLAVIPTALAAVCIRIGNFMNQEILGTPADLPWAVIFGHPIDGSACVPRHPVQIYEALAYLFIFGILLRLWRKDPSLKQEGKIGGLFLIVVFSVRFFLEFFKEEQSVYSMTYLTMGQILSIPLIGLGLWFFFHRKN